MSADEKIGAPWSGAVLPWIGVATIVGGLFWLMQRKGPKMTKLEKAALAMLTALADKCEAYETKIESMKAEADRDVARALAAEKRNDDAEHTRALIQRDVEATRAELVGANAEIERLREELAKEIGKRNARAKR